MATDATITSNVVTGATIIAGETTATITSNVVEGNNITGQVTPGAQGDKGDTGATGPQGATGSTGPQGTTGAKGDTGSTGATGAKGDTGAAGAKGDKGDTGSPGDASVLSLLAKTANYTLLTTDAAVLADATGGAITMTLPTAVGVTGKVYTVKRVNSGANAVTVGTTSAQTIDGSTTAAINVQYQSLSVASDGANWNII